MGPPHTRLWRRAGAGCALAAALCGAAAASAQAPGGDHVEVQFARLRYAGGHDQPRPRGLERLAWEVRRRTSIAMALDVAAVDPSDDALFAQPLLVWLGDAGFPPLPEAAVTRLRRHLGMGGSLLVDCSDGQPDGAFAQAVRRELARILPDAPLQRVPPAHVLYKSFYLVDRHGGRVPSRAFLEGVSLEGRLAVVLTTNDLAGAMARDAFGAWDYPVDAGPAAREAAFRLGVNWAMYALCLDYKEDQVHIPFILQRRR